MTREPDTERPLRNRIATTLVDNRRVVLVVTLAVLFAVSSGVVFLEEDSGLPSFELGTDEEAKLEYIEQNFSTGGEGEIVQVLVRGENVFEKETLVATLELQQEIRDNETVAPTLAAERQTAGIANAVAQAAIQHQYPDRTDPTLEQQQAALERLSQEQIDTIVAQLLDGEASEDALVFLPNDYEQESGNVTSTMVVVFQSADTEYAPTAAPPEIVDSQLAIEAIATDSDVETAVVGSGILTDEEQRALDDTMSLVGPAALLLVVGILAIAYRDVLDVVLGLVGIVLVQLWTFGTLGWLGMSFNPVLIAVPVLLVGLSIDYCIHVFMRYRETLARGETDIEQAMTAGLAGVGGALVWVTVTTAIGFLSNVASPVGPIRQLGFVAAVGIVGSFVVFVLALPLVKVSLDGLLEGVGLDRRSAPLGQSGGVVSRVLQGGAIAARSAPLAVLVAILLVTALTTVAAASVSTSWGPEDNMVDGAPEWTSHLPESVQPGEYTARDDLRYLNDHYVRHGSEVELLVEGTVTDDTTLERVAAARSRAADQETVVTLADGSPRAVSPLTVIERVASQDESFATVVADADTDGDGIPDRNLEAVYDALYERAPEQAAEVLHREDGEYVALRMAVAVNPEADGATMRSEFETVSAQLDADGQTVTVTGQPILEEIIQQHLLSTLLQSLGLTLVAVLAVLMVVFRVVHGSATLGLVTLAPVVLAVSWIIGTMTVLGYPLSVLNAIIASLTIGIGIDYSIHVSERFSEELDETTSVESAISTTVRGTGGALLGSAATTAAGFGVLGLAIHPPLQQFGTVTAIMIGYAFLGAVVVLPSLLVCWARYTGTATRQTSGTREEEIADPQ